jgi:inward rectifier potassium channel
MKRPDFDPGLTQQFISPFRRVINRDGTFNVHRRGGTWHDFHPYLHLINLSWPAFLAVTFIAYLVVNTLFAVIYDVLAPGQLTGGAMATPADHFLTAFYFSAHTLTTVGYGNIAPSGNTANIIAALEAMVGVLGFAVATGLLYGRVSRPSAKIGFSENMIIAPYQDGTSLQFRVVNRRRNDLMELEARVMLMTVEMKDGKQSRQYLPLKLERDKVLFLPLTWTVVHPIDEESPLRGRTAEDLANAQMEVLILLKAYDDTFSQTVLSRYSYRHDEIRWNKRFAPAFAVDSAGDMVLELEKLGYFNEAG